MWKFPGRNEYKKLDYIKDDDGDVFIELKKSVPITLSHMIRRE